MQRTVLQYQRNVLLAASTSYGALAAAVPTAFVAHRHLALSLGVAATLAAAALVVAVLRASDLGRHRGRLATGLLLTGPLSPVILARRTRRWQPVLLLRPGSSHR